MLCWKRLKISKFDHDVLVWSRSGIEKLRIWGNTGMVNNESLQHQRMWQLKFEYLKVNILFFLMIMMDEHNVLKTLDHWVSSDTLTWATRWGWSVLSLSSRSQLYHGPPLLIQSHLDAFSAASIMFLVVLLSCYPLMPRSLISDVMNALQNPCRHINVVWVGHPTILSTFFYQFKIFGLLMILGPIHLIFPGDSEPLV